MSTFSKKVVHFLENIPLLSYEVIQFHLDFETELSAVVPRYPQWIHCQETFQLSVVTVLDSVTVLSGPCTVPTCVPEVV